MLKMEKEYITQYGDIPTDYYERLDYLIRHTHITKTKPNLIDEINRIHSIGWKKISYTIYLVPKATPRPRSGKGGIFYVKGAKDNKKFFKKFMEEVDIPLINTPIKFWCKSYLPTPKSMSAVEKICAEMGLIYPVSKPDVDNVLKTYSDMIQDLLISDDALIIEAYTSKRYSIKPRIEICIEYMEDFDSHFNFKKFLKKGE